MSRNTNIFNDPARPAVLARAGASGPERLRLAEDAEVFRGAMVSQAGSKALQHTPIGSVWNAPRAKR